MPPKAPRLTHSLEAVVDAVGSAPPDTPAYGLQLCDDTGLGPGTVYPVLERLVELGWVTTWQEEEQPSGRPRRRYYEITGAGRSELAEARAAREERRRRLRGAFTRPRPGEA